MKPLAVSLLLLAFVCLGCTQQPSPAPSTTIPPTQPMPTFRTTRSGAGFDYYLLTLSWSPEFCLSHPNAAECAAHPAFVLHGLWPENNDGSYPQHCGNAPGPTNPMAFADIFPDSGLLRHEWQTHGTCSGLTPEAYFNAARKAYRSVTIPRQLATLQQPTQRPPQQILADFAAANPSLPANSMTLSCGNNQLTAVTVCLDKDLHAIACSGVRTCRANTVKITPPGAANN